MQYNLMVKHKPSILNHADALSCHPNYPPVPPAKDEIGLPPSLFMHNMSALELDDDVLCVQCHSTDKLQKLSHHHKITCQGGHWTLGFCLVRVGHDDLKRGIISLYHDFATAGHPGTLKTCLTIT